MDTRRTIRPMTLGFAALVWALLGLLVLTGCSGGDSVQTDDATDPQCDANKARAEQALAKLLDLKEVVVARGRLNPPDAQWHAVASRSRDRIVRTAPARRRLQGVEPPSEPARKMAPPPIATRGTDDPVRVYAENVERVVRVSAPDGGYDLGSGIFVQDDRHILTNFHVVVGFPTVDVYYHPAEGAEIGVEKPRLASVVAADPEKDLALLQLNVGGRASPAPLAAEDEVEVGSEVYAIGHPSGLYWTFTRGVVSQVRKDFAWGDEDIQHRANVVQTQTPINPGNSGGPLFDGAGRVIGINSFIYLEAEGLNFAVAGSEIAAFMQDKPAPPSYEPLDARDLNGDGRVDTWAYDQNYDHVADLWLYDAEGDGVPEVTVSDDDRDGIPDLVYVYEDGKEFQGWDEDGDGKIDYFGWFVQDDEGGWIEECTEG